MSLDLDANNIDGENVVLVQLTRLESEGNTNNERWEKETRKRGGHKTSERGHGFVQNMKKCWIEREGEGEGSIDNQENENIKPNVEVSNMEQKKKRRNIMKGQRK